MIPVIQKITPDPDRFENEVARPGRIFLAKNTSPKGKDWKGHEYWRAAIPWMKSTYGQVCQYSSHWISSDTGFNSIEHFQPKDLQPEHAYEWNNFRLVCGRLNGKRGVKPVTDPFLIPEGLYEIVFPALLVRVSSGYPPDLTDLAKKTIDILGLNDENTCVSNRKHWFFAYKNREINFEFLKKVAPLLANEMDRQMQLNQ